MRVFSGAWGGGTAPIARLLSRISIRRVAVLVGALGLAGSVSGCGGDPFYPTPTRKAQDANNPTPQTLAITDDLEPPTPAARPSPASSSSATYYRQVEKNLLSQGLLREDIAPRDAPFGARQLTDNFVKVALYDEFGDSQGRLTSGERVSELRRWDAPVKMRIEFGDSVDAATRAKDRAKISSYAGRLARVSGHPVKLADRGANFTVLIVNEDERRALGPRLSALVPGIAAGTIEAISTLPPSALCVVYTFSDGHSPIYNRAVAVIRAEHPERLKNVCINEELAQGLGLANDSPKARPSIFNDDEEFALLTRHDELLLKILYDPRLKPGMKEAAARPIVTTIATELLGGDS